MGANNKRPKSKPTKKRQVNFPRTPIDRHAKKGKRLVPPLASIDLSFVNWRDNRMPEMLWAIILRAALPREKAFSHFEKVLFFIAGHKDQTMFQDLTMTGISKLGETNRLELIQKIAETEECLKALSCLLAYPSLPAYESWKSVLPQITPDTTFLFPGVAFGLNQHSLESTDCRWVRVMALIMTGTLGVPQEVKNMLLEYPQQLGDQAYVRPAIRSMEMVAGSEESNWSASFWQESLHQSACWPYGTQFDESLTSRPPTTKDISDALYHLHMHWKRGIVTTGVDPKRDAIFGSAIYAMTILIESVNPDIRQGILGRLGLRSIFETYANLVFLCANDNKDLWASWRDYGIGQAKLVSLKIDEFQQLPNYLDADTIYHIANEDKWDEFTSIDLGNWAGKDLRNICHSHGIKELYDKFFVWTSGFAHASWSGMRESVFVTCANPLHRYHRIPGTTALKDTLIDSTQLTNLILAIVDVNYPNFGFRFHVEDIASSSPAPVDQG